MSSPHAIEVLLEQATSLLLAMSDSARLDAEVLLADVLQKNRAYLYAYGDVELDPAALHLFLQYVERRKNGEPIAHITGQREFWSLSLAVNASTLIPRPDTEVLVETALRVCDKKNAQVLDLGTGTGAIALALAHEQPQWRIDAVDRQLQAVALAKQNAQNLQLHNVRVYESDWFSAVEENARFDIIVSNPPYIAASDKHLCEGDVRFEPRSALVADEEGFADLFFIAHTAKKYLAENAVLLLEHGFEQGEHLRNYLSQCGYVAVKTENDYNNNARVTWGVWSRGMSHE